MSKNRNKRNTKSSLKSLKAKRKKAFLGGFNFSPSMIADAKKEQQKCKRLNSQKLLRL